jgi:hypothetical protein
MSHSRQDISTGSTIATFPIDVFPPHLCSLKHCYSPLPYESTIPRDVQARTPTHLSTPFDSPSSTVRIRHEARDPRIVKYSTAVHYRPRCYPRFVRACAIVRGKVREWWILPLYRLKAPYAEVMSRVARARGQNPRRRVCARSDPQ